MMKFGTRKAPEKNGGKFHQKHDIELPQIDFHYENPKNLYFTDFHPNNKLFYLFIIEEEEPTLGRIKNRSTNQFKLYDAQDIQRYRKYPGTDKIYTFIGFADPNSREEAKSTKRLRYSSFDLLIFNYPYKKEENENKNKVFMPDSSLYYFYCVEHRENFGSFHCKNTRLFKIKCQDLQRGYKLSEEDSKIFIFFGFDDRKTRNAMFKKRYDHSIYCHRNKDHIPDVHIYHLHEEEDNEDEKDILEKIKKEKEANENGEDHTDENNDSDSNEGIFDDSDDDYDANDPNDGNEDD